MYVSRHWLLLDVSRAWSLSPEVWRWLQQRLLSRWGTTYFCSWMALLQCAATPTGLLWQPWGHIKRMCALEKKTANMASSRLQRHTLYSGKRVFNRGCNICIFKKWSCRHKAERRDVDFNYKNENRLNVLWKRKWLNVESRTFDISNTFKEMSDLFKHIIALHLSQEVWQV